MLTIQLQAKGKTADANINMITAGSPLSFNQLDEEANMLRTQLVTQLYSAEYVHSSFVGITLINSDPAVLHAIINILPALCKARPTIAPLVVSSMTSWTPAAMQGAGRPAMQIRAVDKTLRTVMVHLHK